ncbi:MAG: methyltransferase domain-containing protein [Pseudomonadota bacterium]
MNSTSSRAISVALLLACGACGGQSPPPHVSPDLPARMPTMADAGTAAAGPGSVAPSEGASAERAPGSTEAARTEPVTETSVAEAPSDAPSRRPDVIYVPTPQKVVDRMLELAKVKQSDLVYDLGCGDGRIVVTAAKRFGARAVGFDIDPVRVAEARENVRKNGVEHLVTIEQKDIFTLDLSPADVVTLYLLPELNVKLVPQLEKLKPGARIVSHDFDMRGVTPVQRVRVMPDEGGREHDVFLWIAPINKEASGGT